MNRLALSRVVAFAVVSASGTLAGAAPAHNVCVPYALGVPTRNQPPKWVAWAGSKGDVDLGLDDPRWEGAVGHSFGLGAAKAPLQMRAVWSDQGGDYLYMSFIMDLEGLASAGLEAPRDLFLGFRRSVKYDPGTPTVPEDDQYGYIFQFHLKTGASAALVEPVHCARPVDSSGTTHDGCSEAASTPRDYWSLFVDNNQPGTCAGAASHFTPLTGTALSAPLTWMSDQQAVRYWKISTANRWAIQLRLPLVDAGQPITAGIDRDSTFWYQATAQTTAGNFSNVGWWPRESSAALCYSTAGGGFIDQQALLNPDNYSRMTRITTDRTGCDGGIRIETAGIGALADYAGDAVAAAGENLSGDVLFKAVKADGVTPVVNTVVAQIENTSSDPINQPLMARFRLALWGSTSWSDSKWLDMRTTIPTAAGQQPGICLGNSDPNAADTCTPSVSLAPHAKAAFTFKWTIGDDTGTGGIGPSEYCKFQRTPPAALGTCGACACTDPSAKCDLSTDTGTRSSVGASTTSFWPCVSSYRDHQCLLVELTAPGSTTSGTTVGNVNFEQQSAWNNMSFSQMSVVAREALIDARALPTQPGQLQQDIYLIAMARNMPAVIPGGAISGATYVREQALTRAETLAAPYLQDLDKQPPGKIAEIVRTLRQSATHVTLEPAMRIAAAATTNDDAKRFRERIQRVARALQIMPDHEAQRVTALLQLVLANKNAADLSQAIVAAVGPVEAAGIVPTLEIYPFYQPLGEGHAYMPMTAFTVFLSHEGAMTGMAWLIDGATRVGENVYHLTIPVGFARRIQVRAQAIESTDQLAPPNASWPCAAGCACGGGAQRRCGLLSVVGNTTPGLIAGVLVVRRRKKKPARRAA